MKNIFCKKFLFFVICSLLFLTTAHSQISVAPQHDFYSDAQVWYLKGLIKSLPPLRPYPSSNIKEMLEDVIQNGKQSDIAKAESYMEELTGRVLHVYAEAEDDSVVNTEKPSSESGVSGESETSFSNMFVPSCGVNGELTFLDELIGFGYKLGVTGRTVQDDSSYRSLYTNSASDGRYDPATVGSYYFYIDADTSLSIGTTSDYAQVGINRNGYGWFLSDGLAINDSCFHKGNFSYTHIDEKWRYSQLLSVIGASDNDGDAFPTNNKFFAFHTIEVDLTPKLMFSYYESIVFGKRFDPVYFIPTPYMIAQGLGGYKDNLQMGVRLDWKIINGLMWTSDLYIDDVDFNNDIKFNFDTRNRLAFKTGLIYASPLDFLSRVAVDYTIITPYTYSHYDTSSDGVMYASTTNYQDYTNSGVCMGSSIPPNSDVLTLSADFTPIERLHINVKTRFIRHANVCESLTDEEAMIYLLADSGVYSSDGSIYTHQYTNSGILSTADNALNFLTQSHKMYIVQSGLSASYALKRAFWGKLSFTASYNFEYIHNKGVDSSLYPGGYVTSNGDGTYKISGSGSYTQEEVVSYFKSLWISNFTDDFSNYFTIGLRYEF